MTSPTLISGSIEISPLNDTVYAIKRPSKAVPPKYIKNPAKSSSRSGRERSKKGQDAIASPDSYVSAHRSLDLVVPRIDIQQASPILGSTSSPVMGISRCPSMPAIIPEHIPVYMIDVQAKKPQLVRPGTSPHLATEEYSAWSVSSPHGWSSGRVPLLPLPGTPGLDSVQSPFASPTYIGKGQKTISIPIPMATGSTDTGQSVPTTFRFLGSNTSLSSSPPRRSSLPDLRVANPRTSSAGSCNTAITTSSATSMTFVPVHGFAATARTTSQSSGISTVTQRIGILRVTNPDPPSPCHSLSFRSEATLVNLQDDANAERNNSFPSAPSDVIASLHIDSSSSGLLATLAQKRLVSCPPAPISVDQANGYGRREGPSHSTSPSTASYLSPALNFNQLTPSSGTNSASTASFRFSDSCNSRGSPGSPSSPSTAESSLPPTPTTPAKSAVSKKGTAKSRLWFHQQSPIRDSKGELSEISSFPPSPKKSNLSAIRVRKARKLKRTKSGSSGDGDNSAGDEHVDSCLESIGASSERQYVPERRRKRYTMSKHRATSPRSQSKESKKSETVCIAQDSKKTGHPQQTQKGIVKTKSQALASPSLAPKTPKTPKSPLLLNRNQMMSPPVSSGQQMENLSTLWTPIGRVILPSPPLVDDMNEDGRELTGADIFSRSILSASSVPRSPRPPQGHKLYSIRENLSRSDMGPPARQRGDHFTHLGVTSEWLSGADNKPRLPSEVTAMREISPNRRSISGPTTGLEQGMLHLSLPLTSPIRWDALNKDLKARCDGKYTDEKDNRAAVDKATKSPTTMQRLPAPGEETQENNFASSSSLPPPQQISYSPRPTLSHLWPLESGYCVPDTPILVPLGVDDHGSRYAGVGNQVDSLREELLEGGAILPGLSSAAASRNQNVAHGNITSPANITIPVGPWGRESVPVHGRRKAVVTSTLDPASAVGLMEVQRARMLCRQQESDRNVSKYDSVYQEEAMYGMPGAYVQEEETAGQEEHQSLIHSLKSSHRPKAKELDLTMHSQNRDRSITERKQENLIDCIDIDENALYARYRKGLGYLYHDDDDDFLEENYYHCDERVPSAYFPSIEECKGASDSRRERRSSAYNTHSSQAKQHQPALRQQEHEWNVQGHKTWEAVIQPQSTKNGQDKRYHDCDAEMEDDNPYAGLMVMEDGFRDRERERERERERSYAADGNGAVRLGEHKRGFNTSEIEKWLQGLKAA